VNRSKVPSALGKEITLPLLVWENRFGVVERNVLIPSTSNSKTLFCGTHALLSKRLALLFKAEVFQKLLFSCALEKHTLAKSAMVSNLSFINLG
jgi:hypothetical protein